MILKNLYIFFIIIFSLSFLLIYEFVSPVSHQVKTLFFGGIIILTIIHIYYFKLYNSIIQSEGISKGILFTSITGGILMVIYASFIYYYSKYTLEYVNANEILIPILNLSIPIIFFILILITFFIDKKYLNKKNNLRLLIGSFIHYGLLYLIIKLLEVFLLIFDMFANWS